jgi:DMSO/TMAO reductase YedYZ molybdopterin-dependent catalytic subunit
MMAGVAAGSAAAYRLAANYHMLPPDGRGIWAPGHSLTYGAQRILTRHSLAREFPRRMISQPSYANGRPPRDEAFLRHQAAGFADWRLTIDGMVARPAAFSVAELRGFPSRSQITHLACEEGWSFIAEWTGVPLSYLLDKVGAAPGARYVVYFSIQPRWWDSVDMADALHPQTLITYAMNGGDLPVGHGGPLRVRVPRQLGYKSVKYATRLTVTDRLKEFGRGMGSFAAERGYSWYNGI